MSGLKLSLGINPTYNRQINVYSNNTDSSVYSKSTFESTNFMGIVSIQYEKPLNLYWQLSVSNNLSGGKYGTDQSSDQNNIFDTTKIRNWNIGNYLNANLSYYPNSRTQLSLGSTLSYYIDNYKNLELNPDQDETFHDNLSERVTLNLYYYISPRLRFEFNSAYNYDIINDEIEYPAGNTTSKSKLKNLAATASLIYKIL
jgi:hypothetical protein